MAASTEAQRRWYQENRERILAARKTPEGRVRANTRAREYHARHKERLNARRRERHLQAWYKLTPDQFDQILASQGGHCAICPTTEPPRGWHVDHDHSCCAGPRSCGECVRGLLCGPCNKGLGMFYDSPDLLRRAAEYLEARR